MSDQVTFTADPTFVVILFMRNFLLVYCLCIASFSSAQYGGPIASATGATTFSAYEEQEILQRLEAMPSIISIKDHPITQSYIKGYMLRYRDKSEKILGRAPAYLPMFEAELRRQGLPDDLKYLAIVESALDPTALSRSGAGGLWQFMPGTGQMYGLTVNNTVDERGDPEKATRAAVQFLKDEYERFGDWSLVLAAYNGGPGRVRRAMRRSGKSDFWEMRSFLPRETRNYVPAFVAATYLHKYGLSHGLQPQNVTLDEQLVTSVPAPFGISLTEAAQATNISVELMRRLNPHCRKDYVPAGRGAACRVPTRVAKDLRNFIEWRVRGMNPELIKEIQSRPIMMEGIPDMTSEYHVEYVDFPADTRLKDFARSKKISEHLLQAWNPRASTYSTQTQQLKIYHAEYVEVVKPIVREKYDLTRMPMISLQTLAVEQVFKPTSLENRGPNANYTLQRYESLLEVWQKHASSMTWQEFVTWNSIRGADVPAPGTRLYVRQ